MSAQSLGMHHILIVEDDDDLRELMTDIFEGITAKVSQASSGNKAFEALQKNPDISIVLSDVRMPDGDGISLIKSIHGWQTDQKKPLIFLVTGYADLTEEEAASYGVKAIIQKPFQTKDLLQIMTGFI